MSETIPAEKPPKWLDQRQLEALFQVAAERPLRDHLLVLLCYRHGLRISEALALRPGNVSLERGTITVHALKGGPTRTFSLGKDILPLVRESLASEPGRRFLFTSREGSRLSRTMAWRIVSGMMQTIGLSKGTVREHGFGPHALRHSLAVGMLDAGLPLEAAKDALRHRSIRSTEVYANVSTGTRRAYWDAMERSAAIVKAKSRGHRKVAPASKRKPRLGLVGKG